jgi:hypothetical protein
MSSAGSTFLSDSSDVVLIGSGIMSALLGAMLKRLGLAQNSGRRHCSQPTDDASTARRTGSSNDLAMAPDCSANT